VQYPTQPRGICWSEHNVGRVLVFNSYPEEEEEEEEEKEEEEEEGEEAGGGLTSVECSLSIMPQRRRRRRRRRDVGPMLVLNHLPAIARTSMRVRRNGTFSGNFSRCMDASKQSPKSMCRILPEYQLGGSLGTSTRPEIGA